MSTEPAPAITEAMIEEVAAYLLNRDEGGDVIVWARRQIQEGKIAPHDGDCTKQCHTCRRCVADQAITDSRAIFSLQAALRQPVQPNMGEDGGVQPVASQGGPDAETWKSALDVLRRLMSNPSICLADKIYDVRESEGKGWDGPDVKAYGSAIKDAEALVGEWTAIANLEAEEGGIGSNKEGSAG